MSPTNAYQSLHGMIAPSEHPRTIYGLSDRLMADAGVTPAELRAAFLLSRGRKGFGWPILSQGFAMLRRLFS